MIQCFKGNFINFPVPQSPKKKGPNSTWKLIEELINEVFVTINFFPE